MPFPNIAIVILDFSLIVLLLFQLCSPYSNCSSNFDPHTVNDEAKKIKSDYITRSDRDESNISIEILNNVQIFSLKII